MTSEHDLETIYNEINKLLKDVCNFLTTEVQNGTLSQATKNEAQKLVARSQQQIETISTISVLQDNASVNYPYLQMQGPNIIEENMSEYVDADDVNHYESDVYEESYDQIEHRVEPVNTPSPLVVDEDLCPFTDVTFNQLETKAVKFGPLWRKERYFILEQKKQYFAGLVGVWLLVYSCCKKDAKMIQAVNLTEYRAEIVEQKKDPTFRIEASNKKTYDFIVRTDKEMDQWIMAINCRKQSNNCVRNLPEVPLIKNSINDDSSSDISDFIVNNNTKTNITIGISDSFDSDGDIYENLDDLRDKKPQPHLLSNRSSESSDISPMLPPRQQVFHGFPSHRIGEENSTYNNVVNRVLMDVNAEQDEEENTYDPVQNTDDYDDEDDIYDELKITEPSVTEPVLVLAKPVPSKSVPKNSIPPKPSNEYEDEEYCSYDVPRIEQTISQNPPTLNNTIEYDEEEEEDVEYDELKTPEQPVTRKVVIKVGQPTEPTRNTTRPAITSPKPKIQFKLDRLSSLSRQKAVTSDSGPDETEPTNNKKLQNIIQHLEGRIPFKGAKH